MSDKFSFPVFRKYLNNASYFKIFSADEFEEIKKMPGGYSLFKFKAKILPDRNFIHDMLNNSDLHWVNIEQSEYEEIRSKTKT